MEFVELPLHYGRCPKWLFTKMERLAREILNLIEVEYGRRKILERLADPLWFQAFGMVLGFDWHSSGLTSTTIGAIRNPLRELGFGVAGGKGRKAFNAKKEIEEEADKLSISPGNLSYLSRLIARIDTSLVQDNYDIYVHAMIFDRNRNYVVIQQGMNGATSLARRYHWGNVKKEEIFDGKEGIAGMKMEKEVLNLTKKENENARKDILAVVEENPLSMLKMGKQMTISSYIFPKRHLVELKDLTKRDIEFFKRVYEYKPDTFDELLLFSGMNKKRMRALALISSLVFGTKLDWKDPIKYCFAHGGKDGTPFPVDRVMMEENINLLKRIVEEARMNESEKRRALEALKRFYFKVIGKRR